MLRLFSIILLFSPSFHVSIAQIDRDLIEETHAALTTLHATTNGGEWRNNVVWDTTTVPMSMNELNS